MVGKRAAAPAGRLTHFLCLPLVNAASRPQLESALLSFRQDAAEDLPSKAIRPVGALHCTLGVMRLSQRELEVAVNALQSLDVLGLLQQTHNDADIPPKPLQLQLTGLESMHEPHNTSILYVAPSDVTARLEPFCLAVQAIFKHKQLLVPDDRPLKLHATVANTIYAKGSSSKHKSKSNGPARIDGRTLQDKYKDFTWASLTLDRIAICEMGAKRHYDSEGRLVGEEYREVAHVTLPV